MTWWAHLRSHARQYVTVFVVALVVLVAGERFWALGKGEWYDRQPVENWVEYHSVEYVSAVPSARQGLGSLRMVSDLTVRREADLTFEDTLFCRASPVSDYEFISQNPSTTSRATPTEDRHLVFWWFNAGYPSSQECFVESVITVDIGPAQKAISVRSSPFTPT